VAPSSPRSGSLPSPCVWRPRATSPGSSRTIRPGLALSSRKPKPSFVIGNTRRHVGVDDLHAIFQRFKDWTERAGLDFGGELGADAAFYSFELACLMNELDQHDAFSLRGPRYSRGPGRARSLRAGPGRQTGGLDIPNTVPGTISDGCAIMVMHLQKAKTRPTPAPS
jgi:hypothetical protein